jgi:hypothetical protein
MARENKNEKEVSPSTRLLAEWQSEVSVYFYTLHDVDLFSCGLLRGGENNQYKR